MYLYEVDERILASAPHTPIYLHTAVGRCHWCNRFEFNDYTSGVHRCIPTKASQ